MRTKRRVLFAALAVAAVGAFTWFVFREPPEPVYQGKPLTYWMQGYIFTNSAALKPKDADLALRQSGTNAIPTLLGLARARDGRWKLQLFALARKLHLLQAEFVPATERHDQAVSGFLALAQDPAVGGEKLAPAVPDLITQFERSSDVECRQTAARALGSIGPAAKSAIPALLQGLSDNSLEVRRSAMNALGGIHAQPEIVVPALMNCLAVPNNRQNAVAALGLFGTNAAPAVRVLLELCMHDPDKFVRVQAGNSLGQIHLEPELVVPSLIQCLKDPDPIPRRFAILAIGLYGADAEPAIPALIELLKGPDTSMSDFAAKALGEIRRQPELVVPALTEYLNQPKANVLTAAPALGAFGAEAKPAVPTLLEMLKTEIGYRQVIGTALKKIDPEAAAKAGIK